MRRWRVNARCCVIRTQRRRPRQSKVWDVSWVVRAWPRANDGAKTSVWVRERTGRGVGKKVVRKVYSNMELVVRAVLKAWKGVSR